MCPRLPTLIFETCQKFSDHLSLLLILNHGKPFLLACGNKDLFHWWLLPNISNLKINNKTRVYFQQSNFIKRIPRLKSKNGTTVKNHCWHYNWSGEIKASSHGSAKARQQPRNPRPMKSPKPNAATRVNNKHTDHKHAHIKLKIKA